MKKAASLLLAVCLVMAAAAFFDQADSLKIETVTSDKDGSKEIQVAENEKFTLNYTTEPSAYAIKDFEVLFQNPELPTGCEITALTMALNYYGYVVDKVTMADQYLPCLPADFFYGENGKLYGSDMNAYFIGNPASSGGYICGTDAIVTAANIYLAEHGSDMEAIDITGAEPKELYQIVSRDTPVVVWVTIFMEDRRMAEGWYTESGEYVDWSTNDHGAVLVGYTDDTVKIADPISGLVEYDRDQFEKVFTSRNNQCVILRST